MHTEDSKEMALDDTPASPDYNNTAVTIDQNPHKKYNKIQILNITASFITTAFIPELNIKTALSLMQYLPHSTSDHIISLIRQAIFH